VFVSINIQVSLFPISTKFIPEGQRYIGLAVTDLDIVVDPEPFVIY
jgi:hypothetical protein